MRMPRIHAVADTDTALERDPHARTARLPKIAFEAVRRALDANKPVLIQVPRKDTYQSWPAETASPLHDAGTAMAPWACPPQAAPTKPPCQPAAGADAPTPRHRCNECGSTKLRAIVLGTDRTAEEFGRAFPESAYRTLRRQQK